MYRLQVRKTNCWWLLPRFLGDCAAEMCFLLSFCCMFFITDSHWLSYQWLCNGKGKVENTCCTDLQQI